MDHKSNPGPWAWIASVKHLAWVFDSAARQVLLHQPLSKCFSNFMLNTLLYGLHNMVYMIWSIWYGLWSNPRCIQIHINRMSNQMIWFWCWWYDSSTNVLTFFSECMCDPYCYPADFMWSFLVFNSHGTRRLYLHGTRWQFTTNTFIGGSHIRVSHLVIGLHTLQWPTWSQPCTH